MPPGRTLKEMELRIENSGSIKSSRYVSFLAVNSFAFFGGLVKLIYTIMVIKLNGCAGEEFEEQEQTTRFGHN